MAARKFGVLSAVLITGGSIICATLLRAVIDALLHEPINYTTYYLAIIVTTLNCGLYWGLASIVLSTIAASLWLPPMGRPLIVEPNDLAGMVLFMVVATLIVWLCNRAASMRRLAEAAAHERQQLLHREQAARQEAERSNRAKDDFLAAVSHELRTPLQSILGWAQLMRACDMSREEAEMATASIERSAHLQTQLINDLLDLSRNVMGKLRLDARPVSVEEVVNEAVRTVLPAAKAKHVHISVESQGDGVVLGDADRLQQVVWKTQSSSRPPAAPCASSWRCERRPLSSPYPTRARASRRSSCRECSIGSSKLRIKVVGRASAWDWRSSSNWSNCTAEA
jgi:signal transduction histidine kinase